MSANPWPMKKEKRHIDCIRCGGAGGSGFPSWMKYSPNGMPGACFRCGGSGIDPKFDKRDESLKTKKDSAGMCGTLKLEGVAQRVRAFPKLKVEAGEKTGSAHLSGFAKIEKMNWWKKEGDTVSASVLADTFVEGNVEFRVPTGRIAALGLRKNVTVSGKLIGQAKTVRILTREARTEVEKKIHSRFPVVIVDGEMYEFTKDDVLSSLEDENNSEKPQMEIPF